MGLRNLQLKPIAHWLSRSGLGKLDIASKRHESSQPYWSVYIQGNSRGHSVNVGGESRWLWLAGVKAYCELAEALTLEQRKIGSRVTNRNGLAAGFMFSSATNRAKLEIAERHLFLHHFFNSLPFPGVQARDYEFMGRLVRCSSAMIPVTDLGFFCAIQIHHDGQCFLGSTGSGYDKSSAERSALRQLDKLLSLHSTHNWSCQKDLPMSPQWYHHLCSGEPRTRERIGKMFMPGTIKATESSLDSDQWMVTQIECVLPHIKLVRAHHPAAQPLEFVAPGSFPRDPRSDPIHPLW